MKEKKQPVKVTQGVVLAIIFVAIVCAWGAVDLTSNLHKIFDYTPVENNVGAWVYIKSVAEISLIVTFITVLEKIFNPK